MGETAYRYVLDSISSTRIASLVANSLRVFFSVVCLVFLANP